MRERRDPAVLVKYDERFLAALRDSFICVHHEAITCFLHSLYCSCRVFVAEAEDQVIGVNKNEHFDRQFFGETLL